MPNHCNNQFTVQGNTEEVIKFVASCIIPKKGDEPLDENQIKTAIIRGSYDDESRYVTEDFCLFKMLKPMPDFGLDPDAKWYDWAIQNWGTKWGCYNTHFEPLKKENSKECSMLITYDTAWSPGDDCLSDHLVDAKYSNLKFHLYYCEPGMGFHGFFYIDKGDLVAKSSAEYSEIPTTLQQAIGAY